MTYRQSSDQMILIAFMQAQNCTQYPGSWRHPESSLDFMSPGFYADLARKLEAAKFHMAFFDDRLAIPDIYKQDHSMTIEYGIRAVKMDPVICAQVMGMATQKLGVGVSYSTTYYEPFHVARVFATLDMMLGGRSAWNIITSLNDSEARNFGASSHLGHDERYDRADEFMEVVLGHWTSWEADALQMNRETGVFADPSKVKALEHKGKFFNSKGPFTVPRSPQGQPVLMQAGQSGRGRDFAARWGELVFALYPNRAVGARLYKGFKEKLAATGRDPRSVKLAPCISVIVGETQMMAEDKRAQIDKLAKPEDAYVLLSEMLNFDLASKPVDEPFNDDELASISGLQTMRDKVVLLSGRKNPTTADFVEFSQRGRITEFPLFVGTPKKITDELGDWFGEVCDGFVLAPTHSPGSHEDFAKLVVPELQRRGLFQTEYAGTTLRENLGLGEPVKTSPVVA